MRVLYAGFDGLGLDVFQMPQLKRFSQLRRVSNWGQATPEIAHTLPSWTSINTGLQIADHGVTDEWKPEYKEVPNKHKYIWDYMHGAGYSCGVLTFPMTYPPRRWDDGWFVCGFPADANDHWPLDLELPNGWHTDWVNLVKATWTHLPERPSTHGAALGGMETTEAITDFELLKLDFLNTAPSVDFLAVQMPMIDRIGHEMIKPEMRDADKSEPVQAMWLVANEMLGRLIEYQRPDVILLASDHGMNIELHTSEGVWALAGLDAAQGTEVPLDNWRVLPTFLDLVGIEVIGLAPSGLVREDPIQDRMRALGYVD